MKINAIIAAALLTTAAGAAVAGPQCTEAPSSDWMDQDAFQQDLKDQGYSIDKFKVTDGQCFEIYGEDKDGVKVEIYFNPVSGDAVKAYRNE